ncbi:hypothetical protein V1227_08335 [Lentzea sp. DG1S-22]|uniref:hypothetical protein n=1 Tax=Lentzea sp. DG1S-22 TaxID=3108822 RepID=UPI002E792DAA|nr:hypothetical protein [Lentzea sp. DG1S-22]WVH82748.1 hypothetical protein V1227_08335 [Lentzea sp. DG1S-22]
MNTSQTITAQHPDPMSKQGSSTTHTRYVAMTEPVLNDLEVKLISAAKQGLELDCRAVKLTKPNGTPDPSRVIRGDVVQGLLTGKYGADLHPHGIRVRYARVVGSCNPKKPDPAFEYNSLVFPVGVKFSDCWIDHPIVAHDTRMPWLHLDNCRIPYFHADRLRVDGSLYLRCLVSEDGNDLGAVRLLGAHIGRNLELDRAKLHNAAGPAFHAEGLQVDRALRFRAADLKSKCDTGAIQLVNAHVRGDLWLDGTHVDNESGPALNAEGLHVGGSLLLCSGFTATAKSNELATVHLMSVSVGSRLDFSEGRDCTGHLWDVPRGQERAYLPPIAAKIENQKKNEHRNHLVLDLGCASTNDLRLPMQTVCTRSRPPWRLRKRCQPKSKIIVVGLKYAMLSRESDHTHWPHWLRDHTDRFDAEPYQNLAKTLRDSGRTGDARRLLIKLENARFKHSRARWWPPTFVWHLAKWCFVGHGYRPGKALLGLLLVFIATWWLLVQAQHSDAIYRPATRVEGLTNTPSSTPTTTITVSTPTAAASATPAPVTISPPPTSTATSSNPSPATTTPNSATDQCGGTEVARLAADISLPLINTNARLRCDFRPGDASWYARGSLGLQVLGWFFATLFIVGVTGVMRKD